MVESKASARGEVMDGRYVLRTPIGQTATTTVYLATDTKTATTVEVEIMKPGFAPASFASMALVHEARIAAQVNHPCVRSAIDVGARDSGSPYIVRRHVDGETLVERLRLTGVLPIADVMRIGLDLLSVLVAAHDANVVHGSIGPDRVFVADRDGVVLSVMLSGFGAGEWSAETEDDEALGFSNLVFVAPERVDGEPASVSADLYAVAALLFVAVTGTPPYSATRQDIPARLHRVLLQALDPRPERRFPTARAMLHALLVARVGLGTAYAPAGESIRARRESGIHRIGKERRGEPTCTTVLELDLECDKDDSGDEQEQELAELPPTKRTGPYPIEPTLVSRAS